MGNVYPQCASFFALKMGICFRQEGHKPSQMSTEGCGTKSMLKNRAENFARHLQNRLRSLSESEDGTWVSTGDPSSLSSSSENDTFFEIDSNITSPEEEITEPEYLAPTNYVDDLPTSPADVREIRLVKRESVDEQFFDADENNRSRESSPKVEETVTRPCKPVSLPFPIPLSPHNQYRNFPEEPHVNGTTGNAYLDAELTNSTCDGSLKYEEKYHSPVVLNCNGCLNTKTKKGKYSHLKFKFVDERDLNLRVQGDRLQDVPVTDCNSCVSSDDIEQRLKDVPVTESDSCILSDDITERLQDVSVTEKSNSCISSDDITERLQEVPLTDQISIKSIDLSNKNPEVSENQTLNGSNKIMSKQPVKPDGEEDEENLTLSEILQVIHQEIKLERRNAEVLQETTAPAPPNSSESSSETSKNPEISVSEIAENKPLPKTVEEEEEEDIETRRSRFRRCSSLKSGKTPPGTPGRKKMVRFADVLGLDLADVKTFLDEVPTIPKSAYSDLYGVESSTPPSADPFPRVSQQLDRKERVVIPLFQQPGGHPNFIEKLRALNVCLENAVVTDPYLLAITGTVRVRNIDYHKSVHIRYTMNNWKTYADLQARYVPNSCDGFSDKFTFLLYAHTLNVGQRLEFAVRFQSRGSQFWDNNGGTNYVFECVSQDNPCIVTAPNVPPSPIGSWPKFY